MTHRWKRNGGHSSQKRRKKRKARAKKSKPAQTQAAPMRKQAPPMPTEPAVINFNDGFCNPHKIAADADASQAKLDDIQRRGWTADEARMMARDGE